MTNFLLEALLNLLDWGALIVAIAIIFRKAISDYIATKISHESLIQLEKMKSEQRVSENAKRDMNLHVASLFDRVSGDLIAKKMQAAEDLLMARQSLARFHMLTHYMQVFDISKILVMTDKNIAELFRDLMIPFDGKLDEFKVDKTRPELYLGERALKAFEIYEMIILSAYATLKLVAQNVKNKDKLLKKDLKLTQLIVEYVPASKEGFEKFGESYAYYWASYFYDEILKAARDEIQNLNRLEENVNAVSEMTYHTYKAAEKTMKELGNPLNLPLSPVFQSERSKEN